MMAFAILCAITSIAVISEILLPGRSYYQSGWYNVVLATLVVLLLMRMQRLLRSVASPRTRMSLAAVGFGVTLVGAAGIACGLLAPQPRTIVGAPGQIVPVGELGGSIAFPLLDAPSAAFRRPRLEGGFIVRPVSRTVVEVEAFDRRGGRLTVTQPTGAAFLSPVLLMQSHQRIAGMDLPYDTFAIPAAHRLVKAVLFTAQEAAAMRGVSGAPSAAVLFDAENDSGKSLPGAIALARDGATIRVAQTQLRPTVLNYPALEIVAVPNAIVTAIGVLVALAGMALVRFKIASNS